MDNDDIVYGVDQPLFRRNVTSETLRSPLHFTALYRGYTAFILLLVDGNALVASWHGTMVHANGEIRTFDFTTASHYRPGQELEFVRELSNLYKQVVDDKWKHEPPDLQDLGRRWEAHMRKLKAMDREKSYKDKAPWLKARLN